MESAQTRRAVAAAIATASGLGLSVSDAIVLNDSNRLVVQLKPGDIVARVTHTTHHTTVHGANAELELEVVKWLTASDSPVAPLDPRVEPRVAERDGFAITLWTYLQAVPRPPSSAVYVRALRRLHADLRHIDLSTPRVMDRIAATRRDVENAEVTPDLAEPDRALLANTLRDLGQSIARSPSPEQVLHGEPHPWNLLNTTHGPLFIDFENTARGPVEYDLAWVPRDVSDRYPDVDEALVADCRGVVLAIIAMHRWRCGDEHPSGRASGVAFLKAVADGPPWPALDEVTW